MFFTSSANSENVSNHGCRLFAIISLNRCSVNDAEPFKYSFVIMEAEIVNKRSSEQKFLSGRNLETERLSFSAFPISLPNCLVRRFIIFYSMFREINMTSRLNGRYLAERRETSRGEVLGSAGICECSDRKTVKNDKQRKFTEMRSCDLSELLFIHESILKTFIFNGG